MAATTPTVAANSNGSGLVVGVGTTSATDTIQIWKIDPLGNTVKLSAGITMSGPSHGLYTGQFTDNNVAAGSSYSYFARAVDGSGNTADSSTDQSSLTLNSVFIHLIDKMNPDTNIGAYALQLTDIEPYSQSFKFADVSNFYPATTVPTVRQSAIKELTVGFTAIVTPANSSNLPLLQGMAASNAYSCLRNAMGEIWFGRLSQYAENYQGAQTNVVFMFQQLGFSEDIS